MPPDEGAATFRARGGVRHGRAARHLAAYGALAAVPLLMLASWSGAASLAGVGALLAAVAVLARGVRRAHGTLTVTDAAVRWSDDYGRPWERPRAEVVVGWHEEARAVITFAGGDALVLTLDSPEDARRCLDAAGVGVRQRAMVFETRSTWLRMAWFFGAFAMGFAALMLAIVTLFAFMVFPWAGVAMLPLLGLTAAVTVLMLRPVDSLEVLVGADGVTVRGEVDDRFVRYADLAAVEDGPREVTLRLRDGRAIALSGPALGAWQRRALAARLRDALGAHRPTTATERTRAMLARGEVPFDAWRDGLREGLRREAVYRQQALERDDLVSVLGDPAAPPTPRGAARPTRTRATARSSGRPTRRRPRRSSPRRATTTARAIGSSTAPTPTSTSATSPSPGRASPPTPASRWAARWTTPSA